jgi:uncharacterized protein YjbI with pentapeptide repeats/beta-lactamase regulating signal transducer with metallopeptidase domain
MPHVDLFGNIARVGIVILVNGLWHGAIIVFVAWLALFLFRGANASTRYAVWLIALLAVLAVPIATSLQHVGFDDGKSIAVAPPVAAASKVPAVKSVAPPKSAVKPATRPATTSTFALPAVHFEVPVLRAPVPALVAEILFGLWLATALALIVRLVAAFLVLERLKRDSLPLDVEYRDAMPRWAAAMKGERDVRLCVSDRIEVPVAVGLFDAMILLPAHLVESLDPAEIDQISLHELGHLLRADDWSNALQRVISALLFFNPAVWFIARQLDVEREVACDDYVLQATGAVRPYASCLARMAEMTVWPHSPLAAPGVFATRKSISIRIERLLRTGRAIGSHIAPKTAGAALVAMVGMFFLLNVVTPCVAYTAVAAPVTVAQTTPSPSPSASPSPTMRPAKWHYVLTAPAAAKPKPSWKPQTSPKRMASVHIPAMDFTVPGTDVDTPPVDVHVPAIHVHTPATHVHVPAQTIAATTFECTGCNFGGADLRGRDFRGQHLMGANFDRARLQGARFDGAELTGSNFEGADLRDVSFRNADLSGCNLDHAQLAGAVFDGAKLEGCNIRTADLTPAQVRVFLQTCVGCSFERVNLRGQDLRNLHVVGTSLAHADLTGADLSGSSFEGVDFSNAEFSGARLDGTKFTGCDFERADLRNVDLSKASMTGSSIGDAIMR